MKSTRYNLFTGLDYLKMKVVKECIRETKGNSTGTIQIRNLKREREKDSIRGVVRGIREC